MSESSFNPPPAPTNALQRFAQLAALRKQVANDLRKSQRRQKELETYLATSERVTEALQILSDELFNETLSVIEHHLTEALQEILEQPIKLVSDVTFKNKSAAVDFYIERDGNQEDILKGQGGSVANILSIGLRMFALATLDSEKHRRFLVLDEQDCWLRPDLVPRLVKMVRDASRDLGYQVLMVSHHDQEVFREYADQIYELVSGKDGVARLIEK